MSLEDAVRQVLFGSHLEDKLLNLDGVEIPANLDWNPLTNIESPGRSTALGFSAKQIKFPRVSSFHLDEKRALALHFFANHELLAIEMMAAAILMFPNQGNRFVKGLLSTIKDEQKHFSLYCRRMKKLGVEFGDYPLNDFFWRQFRAVKTPEEFYALVALTFESANLDFTLFYGEVFEEVEDFESKKILEIVLEDEIRHVSIGRSFLEDRMKVKDLWNYYECLLPEKVTPARSKGIRFFDEPRIKAGFSREFIESLKSYKDDFRVTNRKGWDGESKE